MGGKAIKMKDRNGNKVYPCPYYPVGSVYISITDISPSDFFGGTWKKIESRFLIASGTAIGEAGESYNFIAGATGGEYSHKLTKAELPDYYLQGLYWNGNEWPLTLDGGDWGTGYKLAYEYGHHKNGQEGALLTRSGGSDMPHNNLPPFLVVNMWVRTA